MAMYCYTPATELEYFLEGFTQRIMFIKALFKINDQGMMNAILTRHADIIDMKYSI